MTVKSLRSLCTGAGDVTLGETGSRAVATPRIYLSMPQVSLAALTVDYQNLDADLDSSVTGGSGARRH